MESTTDNKKEIDAGVLAPSQKDAIPNAQVAVETNTPVAKKTRRAMRKRMDSTVEESPPNPGPPKTPGTSGDRTLSGETPRRSCRKSVRPPIDYEDIVRSAKKLIQDGEDGKEEGQESEAAVQKWNVAEVGRISRKRGRKSKRLTSKKLKTDQDEDQDTYQLELPDVKEVQPDVKELSKSKRLTSKKLKKDQDEPQDTHTEKDIRNAEQSEDQLVQPDVKELQPEEKLVQSGAKEDTEVQPDVHNELQKPQQAVAVVEEAEIPASNLKVKVASSRVSRASMKHDTSTASSLKKKPKQYKHIVADEDIDELGLTPLDVESCEESKSEQILEDEQMAPLALEEENPTEKQETLAESAKVAEQVVEEEEMPLQYLDKSFPEEEMPSLIMLDDEETEKPQLNTTFDADDIKQKDQSVILVESPGVESVGEGHNPSIKVVLTTTDDTNETLLNLENASPKGKKSKGYRFPTPFITKKSFKFSDPPEASAMLEPESKYGRRRSKSTDAMSRTVTFQTTDVEIVSVFDNDKRWKGGVNLNNVTNRRKRSKSLEERNYLTSRIPKPKCQLLVRPKPVTPSQVKKRTKLPDFTAIHQKQFAKMESLIDHMERKAERAKVLTTSALKKPPGSTAKKAHISVAERAEGARPKALKQIDMTADRPVVAKNPEKILPPSRLPLKSALNVASAAPRPAFNLSTATVKTFNATLGSKSTAESQKDKLAKRRQRHMDMFKGRPAAKTQGEKAEFIRGVRLNRRFELQMQHRKHLEED